MLPTLDVSDIPAARATMKELRAGLPVPDETGISVTDVTVPGPAGAPDVTLRIYRPDEVTGPIGIYDVHGGGFILGDIDASHAGNVALARAVGAVVVTVEYRLAPEAPFPAPLEDAYAGLVWFAEHAADYGVEPARIAIHGISAGGGLCAGLALLARDRGGPAIAFQYLGVPEVDDRLTTPSMTAFTDTPIWNRPNAIVSWDSYLGEGVPGSADVSPYAAPARATDLSGLPPAYVSTMAFDPLRDEGIAYGLALLAAGVPVELHLFPGTFHGSTLIEGAAISQREITERVAVLRRALGV
ncbi:MAG TPA: alpha/beta hydrolase [Pseudonocardia sp.]|uniref:alpha/beta hydrolase n=1 Tax=Pseudonocardia sp. TaxID=60912 RepID=UPI0026306BC3|nr:alpha/beta hydrolase [Pseudonocardia sp.]HEV7470769.1 alpha/beta hydrolase [Pseudonocardia sp.]